VAAGGWALEIRPFVVQIVALVAAAAVVVGSAFLVQRLMLPVPRLVPEQWSRWMRRVAQFLWGRKAQQMPGGRTLG
jgi:hypothetical protein